MCMTSSGHIDIDEGAQAIVLAEIAPGIFIARGAVANVGHSFQPDERRLLAVRPQTQSLLRGANGARFAAVLVHDNLRHFALGAEARLDEIHFRLHHRQVVLGTALQNKARTQRSQVGDTGDVEKNVLWQHIGESGENLFRPPALALEIHNVRLHEDGAAIAKGGHRFGREGDIRKFFDLLAEAFRGRLQEVSVPRRALRIQLEILDPAVFQDDELDVLATDVDDDVRIVVELERRFGVRDGFHQRHVCVQHILEDVLRISGCSYPENLERGAFGLDLLPQLLKHLDGILNRVAIGKLIGLAKDFASFAEQDRLGGGGSAIDADKTRDRLAGQKLRWDELLPAVFLAKEF